MPTYRLSINFRDQARFIVSLLSLFYVGIICLVGKIFFHTSRNRINNSEINLAELKDILIIHIGKIGDTVLLTPFLRELRHNAPNARITICTNPLAHELLSHSPYINRVLIFDNRESITNVLLPPFRSVLFSYKNFRKYRYDLAIVPRWDLDITNSSFLAYLSSAQFRIGYSEKVTIEKSYYNKGYDRFYTHNLRENFKQHSVKQFLNIISHIGGKIHNESLELWSSPTDDKNYKKICSDIKSPIVVFCPGADEAKRRWPVKNYIEIGDWLTKHYDCKVAIIGGQKETVLGEAIKSALKDCAINYINKLKLDQLGSFLRNCCLYIGNDTGAMHIAAAAGIPVIEISCHPLYGYPMSPNAPERVSPWTKQCFILQPRNPKKPCKDRCVSSKPHCITMIRAEDVIDIIKNHASEFKLLKK